MAVLAALCESLRDLGKALGGLGAPDRLEEGQGRQAVRLGWPLPGTCVPPPGALEAEGLVDLGLGGQAACGTGGGH